MQLHNMCKYMCVYIYTYVYIFIYICIYICAYIFKYTYMEKKLCCEKHTPINSDSKSFSRRSQRKKHCNYISKSVIKPKFKNAL